MRNAPYTYENQGQRTKYLKGLVTDFPTLLRQDYNVSLVRMEMVKDTQVQWKGDWEGVG